MPIQGFTRFRRHQIGLQAAFGSNAAATRRLPYRGAIVVDPAREDPDVDVGSIDPVMAPFNGVRGITGTWEGKLAYDDAPFLWAGLVKGGVTPTGGGPAKTWDFTAASLTSDPFAYFTDEWGDDVGNDYIVAGAQVIESLEIGFGEDLSAWDVNASTVAARAALGASATGGLSVDATPQWVYGADTEVFLDTVYSSIGSTKLVDAIHGATLSVTNNLDIKRFANGSNTRFEAAGYGRGAREIELQIVVAKTAETIAEAATLDDEPVPNRYVELRTTSPEIITGSTPYSQSIFLPVRLISREDGELNANSTITLTYRGYYDADLGYALRAVVVCGLTSL